ncbi:hypothetical protein D9619_004814 [Psilocybe cf. subviscida]|uniref:Uncharacterized protein n=1 Tax=Psilocybe cf. subviscida TaxID=2480587 RepID=A0A8H5BR02_9AGAR|nr:hypothetical protein D9619_004814 [Psilocybe cf. subviscida]
MGEDELTPNSSQYLRTMLRTSRVLIALVLANAFSLSFSPSSSSTSSIITLTSVFPSTAATAPSTSSSPPSTSNTTPSACSLRSILSKSRLLWLTAEGKTRLTTGYSLSSSHASPPTLSFSRRLVGATATSLIFGASDTILLRNRQPELRKIGQNKHTSKMSLCERLKRSIHFALTPRGVGWTHEATDHILHKFDCSRATFIGSQLMLLVFYILLADVSSILIRANPCFS